MRWIGALSGTAAMVAGLLALSAIGGLATGMAEGSPPGRNEILATEMNYEQDGVVWSIIEPLGGDIEIPGLTPAVASALATAGYTEILTASTADATLPEAVVRLLADEGTVLVIDSDESGG